jgi:hypothetical protein
MKIFPLPFMYCSNLSCKFSRQTQKKLVGFSHYGHFSWIKAHSNHVGNELADRLAKAGANQTIGPARFKYYEATASFSQTLLTQSNQQWQKRWDADPTKYMQSKCFIQSIKQNLTKFNLY